MTPRALTDFLDCTVHGEMQARGTFSGITWEVRTDIAGGYRITVAVPWVECPERMPDHYDFDDGTAECAILGVFVQAPDPAPALADVARWRIVR